ncbi:hypothetical protein Bbelb_026520 [Branchiostoma belcheri]|nr:hypothetical protein Bbelb_026520 [Branchiostoma belcheri]
MGVHRFCTIEHRGDDALTALSPRREIGQSAERAPNSTKNVLKWNLYGDLFALFARPKTQIMLSLRSHRALIALSSRSHRALIALSSRSYGALIALSWRHWYSLRALAKFRSQ